VAFYKPVGDQNQHRVTPTYCRGDRHIADLVRKIQASPAWSSKLIVVTYDENAFWSSAVDVTVIASRPGGRRQRRRGRARIAGTRVRDDSRREIVAHA